VLLGVLVAMPAFGAALGGPPGVPTPFFPPTNWWNQDVSLAPVDPASAAFINFIGASRGLHPDFYGEVSPGSVQTYGIPYIVVDGSQPKLPVWIDYWDESDGGFDPDTGVPIPFYPIPAEAITQAHWIEGGEPGNQAPGGDRHILIVDRTNNHLYELWNTRYQNGRWHAGSGAFFDMNTNGRRPEGWTSADAAGLAILPGLVRYDEACGDAEIGHAFRFTVRATNGWVYPASHRAGSTAGALPMGARLRLKDSVDISEARFPDPCVRRVFRAMKRHGLIVADNGSDLYVTGTFDTRWPALFDGGFHDQFESLRAGDFEVVELGWTPPIAGDPPVEGDLDGDRRPDTSVYYPANGTWYVKGSAGANLARNWGWSATIPVPGDYDRDGVNDLAVYYPANGGWYIKGSTAGSLTRSWGGGTNTPVQADWDGDGTTDPAVYHQASGSWYVRGSTGAQLGWFWGGGASIAVPADWDGDRKTDAAVYYPASGSWQIRGSTGVNSTRSWGWSAALPVPADWDGDGAVDAAVYYPANGTWYIKGSAGLNLTRNWGWNAAWPVPADWDGDGTVDLAVYYPANGTWYIKGSAGLNFTRNWGWSGAHPVFRQYQINKAAGFIR
jgi:hypothetical protein